MNRQNGTWLVAGVLVLSVGLSAGMVMHYRSEAIRYQRQYIDASLELDAVRERLQRTPVAARTALRPERTNRIVEIENDLLLDDVPVFNGEFGNEVTFTAQRPMSQPAGSAPSAGSVEPQTGRGNWMEELRQNDTERYEQVMQQRAAARQRVQDFFARQSAHFLSQDRSSMSAGDQARHDQMLGLLAETWNAVNVMQDDEATREQRQAAAGELRDRVRSLQPMLREQRDRELHQLGRQMGYNESEAADFVEYIYDLIDITSVQSMWRGQRRRGPAQ